MCVLNVIHYVSPSLKANNKKNGYPGESNIIERYSTLKWIFVPGSTVCVVFVPIYAVSNVRFIIFPVKCIQGANNRRILFVSASWKADTWVHPCKKFTWRIIALTICVSVQDKHLLSLLLDCKRLN